MTNPSYQDILAASERIKGRAVRTPLLFSPVLSDRLGARVFLKLETLQRTGSFKFRGAWNAVQALGSAASAGVVACSSGNHAQGVAEAARLAGVPATIVMPHDAPALKRRRTEASGARVIGYDRVTEDRDAIAAAVAREEGAAFIHPFNNADVIAGQGTVGLEVADDLESAGERPDVVVAPCSGGGLTAGIALAVTTRFPGARIFAAEPAGFDDYGRSLLAGRITRNERLTGSVCDALLAPEPGLIGWEINRERLAGAVEASDDEVIRTVGFAFEELRLVVEPGGAVALAAVLAGRVDLARRIVVVVLSGGNIDDAMLTRAVAAYRTSGAAEASPSS